MKEISLMSEKSGDYWVRVARRGALRLFHKAAKHVPAYKDFLKKHGVKTDSITNWEDFTKLPVITKENYLRKYPLEDLHWQGSVAVPLVWTATSGSTGQPFYFSRSNFIDEQSAVIHEIFLRHDPDALRKPSLVLICFGMGIWIGGLITYQAFRLLHQRGYPLSILTPGINKEEIFKALRNIGGVFEKVILCGYPPFLKDIVDEAPQRGINLKKMKVRFLFAAEVFTETFRDYIVDRARVGNIYLDTMNIYGSADLGTMAFETPLSILIRRHAAKKDEIFRDLFTQNERTPTLAQYYSPTICFEAPGRDIIVTGDNSMPLIRYSIGDIGGVYSFDELRKKLKTHRIDLPAEVKNAGLNDSTTTLPFVYIYERSDMSTTLYGLQIYPETIREVLLKKPFNRYLTGKLTLMTKYDSNQDQYLEVHLEMRKDVESLSESFMKIVLSAIVKNLREKNSEYRELSTYLKKRAIPKIRCWPAEDDRYFKPGLKQKWVKNV